METLVGKGRGKKRMSNVVWVNEAGKMRGFGFFVTYDRRQ